MQRLGPTKNRKRKCSECVECFSHWTVFMHWTESGLCTRHEGFKELTHKGVSSTQKNLFLSLNLWCKKLVPQKKEMQWVCWKFWLLDCFDHRGSCCLSRMFSLLQSSLTLCRKRVAVGESEHQLVIHDKAADCSCSLSLKDWFTDFCRPSDVLSNWLTH